ncbi:MAG: transcriptional regulator [Anaerolineae bacterium]|nr:transcriptional regulator [Anaerolineae bacterium]
MLEKLLKLLHDGGIRSYGELAAALSVPESLLEVMLEELARLGYLRSMVEQCGPKCAGCHVSMCAVGGGGKVWVLTEKGGRAAEAV